MKVLERHRALVLLVLYATIVYLYRQVSPFVTIPPVLNSFIFYGRHLFIFIVGVCWLYRMDYVSEWKQFRKKLGRNILLALGVFLALYVANIFLSSLPLAQETNTEVLTNRYIASEGIEAIFFVLVVSVIGPINEELIFRKILIGAEHKGQVMTWFRLLLSSVLFGLIHIYSLDELSVTITYSGLGLILGLVYYWKKNIYFSTFAHIINNSVAYIFIVLELLGILKF